MPELSGSTASSPSAEQLPIRLIEEPTKEAWGSPVEIERRRRIFVSLWAYAYEVLSISLVDDAKYDLEASLIDVSMDTENPIMDAFFREEFDPSTGMWVHKHPQLTRLTAFGKRMGYW